MGACNIATMTFQIQKMRDYYVLKSTNLWAAECLLKILALALVFLFYS